MSMKVTFRKKQSTTNSETEGEAGTKVVTFCAFQANRVSGTQEACALATQGGRPSGSNPVTPKRLQNHARVGYFSLCGQKKLLT